MIHVDIEEKCNILFIVLPHTIRETDAKNPRTRSYKAFPYGVLSVATYVKKFANKEVNVKIIDCNLYEIKESIQLIKSNILKLNPEIVALSMNYDNSYKHLSKISKLVKENSNKQNQQNQPIVILGGSAASFSYKQIFEEQNYIDGICYTEGEIPVISLINESKSNRLNFLENNKSWITKKSIKQGKIPEKSFLTNLDDTIDVDYKLVEVEKYRMTEAFSPFLHNKINDNEKRQFFLVTSRGCPYKCVFCSTCSGLYENKIRYASIDKIISHVEHLITNYGMNVLTLYDDQLLMNKPRAKELFRKLAPFNIRIECPNGLSIAFIDDEMAYLMKNAGMDTVILAVEHGSDYILKKVIHKPLNLKMVKPTVNTLRKYNFFIEAFFVIGIPGEEEKHRIECLNFIREIQFDWCGFNLATPTRGSRLYTICVENGYIDKNLKIDDIQDKKYIINAPPHLIPNEITKKTYIMNLDVNFVNNYRMKIKDYETAAKCFQDVIDRSTNHAFAHYYLAESQKYLNIDSRTININLNRFYTIIKEDKIWKEYACHFNLIKHQTVDVPANNGYIPIKEVT